MTDVRVLSLIVLSVLSIFFGLIAKVAGASNLAILIGVGVVAGIWLAFALFITIINDIAG